jgi:hypothetical protein
LKQLGAERVPNQDEIETKKMVRGGSKNGNPQNVQSHKMLIRLEILRSAEEIERSKSFF